MQKRLMVSSAAFSQKSKEKSKRRRRRKSSKSLDNKYTTTCCFANVFRVMEMAAVLVILELSIFAHNFLMSLLSIHANRDSWMFIFFKSPIGTMVGNKLCFVCGIYSKICKGIASFGKISSISNFFYIFFHL